MTIKECIDIVDNIKPNQYTVKDKVMWLSFLDEIIINDVLKTHEGYDGRYDLFEGYSEDKLSVTLIVPSPYDRLYPAYLKMRIDGENGETAKYNNSQTMYDTYYMEYRKYYNKTHMPLDFTGKGKAMPLKKTTTGLSAAEYENIKRDVYNLLSEDLSEVISPNKLYEIVTAYVYNNVEMLKGKDGYTPVKGVDYFTEAEVQKIVDEVLKIKNAEIEQLDAKLDKTNDMLSSHKNDADNPHGVTAEQTGAYTKNKTDELLGGKADTSHTHGASAVGAYSKEEIDLKLGDIDTALDSILAMQESLIGGETT